MVYFEVLEQEHIEIQHDPIGDLVSKYPEFEPDIKFFKLEISSKQKSNKLTENALSSSRPVDIDYNFPWVKEFMFIYAEKTPQWVISEISYYYNVTYAEELFIKAGLRNIPFALQVLSDLIDKYLNDESAFLRLSIIKEHFVNSITIDTLQVLAKSDPDLIITNILTFGELSSYKEKDQFELLLGEVIRAHPEYLNHYLTYMSKAKVTTNYMHTLLSSFDEAVFREAVKNNYLTFEYIFDQYRTEIVDHPYAKIIIEGIIQKEPQFFTDKYYDIKDVSGLDSGKIITTIVTNKPEFFIQFFKDCIKYDLDQTKLQSLFVQVGSATNIKAYDNASKVLIEFSQLLGKEEKDIRSVYTLFTYFHEKSIKIGKTLYTISFPKNINIYSGLIKTYKNNPGKSLSEIQGIYEQNIKDFIEAGNDRTSTNTNNNLIFFVRPSRKYDDETKQQNAFTPNNQKMLSYFQTIGTVIPYMSEQYDKKEDIPSADTIITEIEAAIRKNPLKKNIFISIGLHGGEDGSAERAGGDRKKEDFERLFALQKANSNVHLDIISCNSGYKDNDISNNNLKNISFDSSFQSSIGGENGGEAILLQAQEKGGQYQKGDFNQDGKVNFHEMLIYRLLNYNASLTPTVFERDGKAIEVADISDKLNDLQSKLG